MQGFCCTNQMPRLCWLELAECGVYLQDYEKLIARLSLHHNFLAILKLHRLQSVSHRQTLPLIQRLCSGTIRKSTQPHISAMCFHTKKKKKRKNTKTWKAIFLPKMDTLLRNSSYILRFLKVLLWKKKNGRISCSYICQPIILSYGFHSYLNTTIYHEYSPVAFSIDAPQLDISLGPNCSCTRGPIDQSKLSKTASLANAGHPFIVDIHLDEDGKKRLPVIDCVSNDTWCRSIHFRVKW